MENQLLSLSKTMISQNQATHIDEESIITEQVNATHDPNGGLNVDASFVLKFAENIINFETVCQYTHHLYLVIKVYSYFFFLDKLI